MRTHVILIVGILVSLLPPSALVPFTLTQSAFAAGESEKQSPEQLKCTELNDKGAAAMKEKNFASAVKLFREALDMDSRSECAKKSLIGAHNAYGMSLIAEPKKAIVQFHRALSLNKSDAAAKKGIEQAVTAMGLNPRSADARIKLADQAQADNDREGVGLEMEAADYLKGHPNQDVVYSDEKK